MPIIIYKELEKYIKDKKEDQFAPVFLLYGEELLCKEAFEKLMDALVPGPGRSLTKSRPLYLIAAIQSNKSRETRYSNSLYNTLDLRCPAMR